MAAEFKIMKIQKPEGTTIFNRAIMSIATTHWILDGPVWEPVRVTQVLEVVYITEELVCELRVGDVWDGAVLVQRPVVGHEAWREVC